MAKNMARIENNIVINIEWCSDRTANTDNLVSVNDLPVAVGDTYDGIDFYHDGEKVLSENQMLMVQVDNYEAALNEIEVALGI